MKIKLQAFLALVFLLSMFSMAWGVTLLDENFDYTAGAYLTDNGWTAHSGTTTFPFTVVNPGLTYTGYALSGIGNAAYTGNGSGQDLNKAFSSPVTSGTAYVSFLMKITSFPNMTQDYPVHFAAAAGATPFVGKMLVQSNGTNFRFGISKASNNTTIIPWTGGTYASGTYDYSFGTTYLIVIKYEFIASTANDVVSLYVNPVISLTEPTPTLTLGAADTGGDATSLATICLRQSSNTPNLCTYDGFRVATTWADLFPSSTVITPSVSSLPEFVIDFGTTSVQSYTLTGSNLTGDIAVTTPNTNFQLSSTGAAPWTNTLTCAASSGSYNGTVYVRFNPAAAGTYSGNITHASNGATTVNVAVSGQANIPSSSTILIDGTINAFATVAGTPSATQFYTLSGDGLSAFIDITVTGPFQIQPAGEDWGTSFSLPPDFAGDVLVQYIPTIAGTDTGAITHVSDGAADQVIDLSGTASTPYAINVNPGTLTFTTVAGTPAAVQSYTLTGVNLTESIVVTAPSTYQVSSASNAGPWTSDITVANTFSGSIYVLYSPTVAGSNNGNITNVANGITTNVALTGSATLPVTPMEIQVGQTLTQSFDAVGGAALASLPTDWKADKSTTVETRGTWTAAVSVTERAGGDGMSTTAGNGIYNFGAGDASLATDRAIGFLSSSSSTKTGNLYTRITNIGATTITSFDVSYDVEKYRKGSNAQGFSMKLYYSADGASWTYAGDALKASWSPDADNTGYTPAPGDSQAKSGTVVISVASGASAYFCWSYGVSSLTTTSNAQALGIDNASFTANATPVTATPTFTPAAGIMDGPTNVTLSSTTPGASIYYTTNGDEPTESSTLYTGFIPVNTTTTVKAVAKATGYDLSPVAVGLFTIPVNVTNIADLRAIPLPSSVIYKLTGEAVLTLKSATNNVKYIQDATGAIQIYDPSGIITTPYNLGDGITGIIGTLTTYSGMLELVPSKNTAAATSTGNVVTPVDVTLSNLDTSYQAKLIRISNVTVTGTGVFGGTPAAKVNYPITDPTGTGVLRTEYIDLDYVGVTEIPATAKTYVGIALQYLTTTQLVPRSAADITDSAPPATPIDVVVTVVGNDIQLNWTPSAGASGYKIMYSEAPDGTYVDFYTSATNSYTAVNEALTYGKRFYKVIATN